MTSYRQVVLTPYCETSFSVINKSEKKYKIQIHKILNDIFISRSKLRVNQRNLFKYNENYNNGSRTIVTIIVGLIQLIQRVIKINDTPLYSFAFFEVISIFFMTDHQFCSLDALEFLRLANLETSQPDLQKI